MNKRSVIVLVILLLLGVLVLSACSAKVSILEMRFDKVYTSSDSELITVRFLAQEGEEEYIYTVDREGILTIEDLPRGAYSVTINRFGAEETFDLNVTKRNYKFDHRLFKEAKGSSAEGTHYIISTIEQFMNLNKMQGASIKVYYHLENDLNLTGYNYIPIDRFDGVLDGRDYGITTGLGRIITGLSINEPEGEYVGLFRRNYGEIRNIRFDNVNIKGKETVGAITGSNYGIIHNCDIRSGIVEGNNLVGSIAGIDRGLITACSTSATINASGYYGRLAGINFSNVTLGAYGLRPAQGGKTSIQGMEPLEMYLTAMDNWYALDKRGVLQTASLNIDISDTALKFIGEFRKIENLPLEMRTLLNFIYNLIYNRGMVIEEGIIARRAYEGAYEDGLNRMLVTGGTFVKETSLDSFINAVMNLINVIPDLRALIPEGGFPEAMGFAVYYDEAQDELIEMQITDNARVVDNVVSYTLYDEVIYAHLSQELLTIQNFIKSEMERNNENADTTEVDRIFSAFNKTVGDVKSMLLDLTLLDLEAEGAVTQIKDKSYNTANKYHKYTMVIDPDIAFKSTLDYIKNSLLTDYKDTIFEETGLTVKFNKQIELIVEIWDNGHFRSVRMNNLDVDVKVEFTKGTQELIRGFFYMMDRNITNFTMTQAEAKIKGNIYDQYSYSLTDCDIDLYLEYEFDDKDRIWYVDYLFRELGFLFN